MASALRSVVTLLARWSLATLDRGGQVDPHPKAKWGRVGRSCRPRRCRTRSQPSRPECVVNQLLCQVLVELILRQVTAPPRAPEYTNHASTTHIPSKERLTRIDK